MSELRNRGVRGHPDRRRRRPQGIPRGDRGGLSRDGRADLHRPPDSLLDAALRRGRSASAIAAVLRRSTQAETAEVARERLEAFEEGAVGPEVPLDRAQLARKWEQVIPFFAFSPEIRRMIYTTNAIESLHSQVRKSVRNKGPLPERSIGDQADLS